MAIVILKTLTQLKKANMKIPICAGNIATDAAKNCITQVLILLR